MLLDAGADLTLTNSMQETPLHQAADSCLLNFVTLLLEYGADPNCKNAAEETPLHLAVFRGRADVAAALLKAGADPSLADGSLNQSPLHYALSLNETECIQLLTTYKTCTYEASEEDKTPEPDAEKTAARNADREQLHESIEDIELEAYTEHLVEAGLDDINALAAHLHGTQTFSLPFLQSIGIAKPGHSKRLLMKLEEPLLFPLSCGSQPTVSQPCCFIGGERDAVRHFIPGGDLYADPGAGCADFRGTTLIRDVGHWVQQEAPEATNAALEVFLHSLE